MALLWFIYSNPTDGKWGHFQSFAYNYNYLLIIYNSYKSKAEVQITNLFNLKDYPLS